MKLETQRLIIEQLTANDTSFLIELLNQRSFKKNIGERYVTDEKSALNFLQDGPFQTYSCDVGMHCVKIKETGEAIGLAGLMRRDYLNMPDLGYAFLEQYHGFGFASEAAREIVNWANFDKGYNRLCAMTTLDNDASVNLLKKLGFIETKLPQVPQDMSESRYFELALVS